MVKGYRGLFRTGMSKAILAWWVITCVCLLLLVRQFAHQERIETYLSTKAGQLAEWAVQQDWSTVRLELSSSVVIKSVAVWQDSDHWLFPSTDSFTHEMDTLAYQSRVMFEDIASQAKPSFMAYFNHNRDTIVYCKRAALVVCFVADSSQLATKTGVSKRAISHLVAKETGAFGVGLFVCTTIWAGILLAMWRKGKEPRDLNHNNVVEYFVLADVVVFPSQYKARRNNCDIALNHRDITLLKYFRAHPNEVISKQTLYDIGWGRDFINSSRALEQHIINLRRKLDPKKCLPSIIDTVHGQGYRYSQATT